VNPAEDDHFTVHGHHGDRPVILAYEAGRLTGDGLAVAEVHRALQDRGSVPSTGSAEGRPADLSDPQVVLAAVQEVLDIDRIDGDHPTREADRPS
jgi:hypothetical protein